MTPAEPCKFRTPIPRSHLHGASVKAILQRGLARPPVLYWRGTRPTVEERKFV